MLEAPPLQEMFAFPPDTVKLLMPEGGKGQPITLLVNAGTLAKLEA